MKQTKNLGLTLVELIVSIAVLSIVTLGVGGLLRLSAEQYSNATKETEVQNLLQSTFATISNSLEDVAVDVYYSGSRLTIVNKDLAILYEKDGDKLYYDEVALTASDDDGRKTAALAASIGKAQANILADHVTSFNVDTSTKDQGFVVVNVTVQFKERSKNLVQNVFMRNLRPAVETESTSEAENNQPSNPGNNQPSDPGNNQPSDPGNNQPSDPGNNQPSNPGNNQPSDPGNNQPNTPPENQTQNYSAQNPTPNEARTELTFSLKLSSGYTSGNFTIRKQGNSYILNVGGEGWCFGNPADGSPTMPDFPWTTEFTLNQNQINWLKEKYGIDVAAELTGGGNNQTPDPGNNPGQNNQDPNQNQNSGVVQDTNATYASNFTYTESAITSGNNWTAITFTLNPDGSNSAQYEIIYRGEPENTYTLVLKTDRDNPWILAGGGKWNFNWIDWGNKPASYNMDAGMRYDFKNAFGIDLEATLKQQTN